MTRILLFGAGGQLGQEVVACAPAHGLDLVAHARAQTDIADAGQVEHAVHSTQPDLVVNAGAYTKVDLAEREPHEAYRANKQGAAVIAKACAAAGIPLVHISTDYVFDGKKSGAYVETDPTAPLGVYGASKLAGENEVREHHKRHVILRTSWVYGKYGANFLKTMLRLAGERDELKVVADQRGTPTSTSDLAEAILTLAPRLTGTENNSFWGTFHFTGDGETSWYQFAEHILAQRLKWVGSRPNLVPITTAEYPTAARRPSNSVLDNSRFKATFGLSGKPWRQSVQETVSALLEPSRG